MTWPRKTWPRNLTDDELLAKVKKQQYGINHGDKRHVINQDSVQVERDSRYNYRYVRFQGVCGQYLSRVHGLTTDWSGKVTDLDGNLTCKRCAKKVGIKLPLEPTTCPTCNGKGKVQPT